MRFCASRRIAASVRSVFRERGPYFCQEPWIGTFSVGADGDVKCCPSYARVSIGNVNDSSIQEIWNSDTLLKMRRALRRGRLPRQCRRQLCPVVVGKRPLEARNRASGIGGKDG